MVIKMNESQIIRTEYSELMKKSYLDYAMSVIISRALPDVRDGLKPVQRRTLYDMHELGIRYDKPYRKCARIVGDTMGKYHPHGDSSIYESLVVMSQDFKKGMPLIDGHGNFGSIEGDGAAAMRYTEARLEKFAQDIFLTDLDKDVVDFMPNFDENETEPVVLPARIPNILVNGAEGIAVGMTTGIPPHNLSEVVDGVVAFLKNDNITTEKLMKYIKGPDFPTGGIVVNQDDLLAIYEGGTGKIKVRGKVVVEEHAGKQRLVITEIPYTMVGAGIGRFLNDVANLVDNKTTTEIMDISNQSSKEGIRIVLELKKGADVENLKNMLYKKTKLEDTFGVNMLAVADGKPETMGLRRLIEYHVNFQFDITTRKYRTLLNKELDKKEIQEGLIKAYDVIDLIIELLRGSQSLKIAKSCLTSGEVTGIKFKSQESKKLASELCFTDKQATAILEMRLYKLIGLELIALLKDHEITLKNIATYEDVLNNYSSMVKVIVDGLKAYKKEFGKTRKTEIENAGEVVFEEKKIEAQEVVFLMDRFGYARVVDIAVYERNKEAADSENHYVVKCLNTNRLCVFTNLGKLHYIKVLDLPHGKFRDKGIPIDNVSNYNTAEEEISAILDARALETGGLIFTTGLGFIKIVEGSEFQVERKTIAATKLQEGDELVSVQMVAENNLVVMQTESGYFLKFSVSDVPIKKKAAVGVRGIKLVRNDKVVQIHVFEEGKETKILYKDKELSLNRLKLSKRDGQGTKQRG